MVFTPTLAEVKKHIDHYWILDAVNILSLDSAQMFAYPGITPDMIIVLDGQYTIHYMGKKITSDRSLLFSFIHEQLWIDFSRLRSCIVIKFKSRGLSSLKPFLNIDAEEIMKSSVAFADSIFGSAIAHLEQHLRTLDPLSIVNELDEWLAARYKKEREGFVVEMAQEVSAACDLKEIMNITKYSYATLERYFKKDSGLTPKQFQSLQRFKKVIRELYITKNTDWQHYVQTYGYYDQSHFIKEIKRYTSYTPTQLLSTPAFIQVRPNY